MSIKISLKKNIADKIIKNYVLFADENFKILGLNKISLNKDEKIIKNTISSNKNNLKDFLIFNLNPNQKVILIKLSKNISSLDNEKIGANFFNFLKSNSIFESTLLEDNFSNKNLKDQSFLEEFVHGIKLRSYEFNKYKTIKKNENFKIDISFKKNFSKFDKKKRFNSLEEGITFTKDLVSEPGNILHPDEYSKRLTQLKKFGLKVSVYDKIKMKKIGMNALLGVGQGSIRGSYLVTIEWNGKKTKSKPLAFVGKGVCFDTGGISLKPAKFMEDMTYDMAG